MAASYEKHKNKENMSALVQNKQPIKNISNHIECALQCTSKRHEALSLCQYNLHTSFYYNV